MSRGFAGGLAEGINQGMQMYALHETLKSRAKADERADAAAAREQEAHALKMREASEVRGMTEGWAKEMGWDPKMAAGSPIRADAPSMGAPQPTETPSAIKLAGPIPQGGLAMNAPAAPYAADNPAGALAPQQPAQPQKPVSAGEYVQRQIFQGDAFSNPEKLNRLAAIAFANNQGAMGIQFLNQVHVATKNGWTKALGSLVSGDTAGATKILKDNGMDIRGELTPVEGKPHTYEADIGGKKTTISADTLFMSGNPEEAYKMQATAREKAAEREMKEREIKIKEREQENNDAESKSKLLTDATQRTLNLAQAGKANRSPVSAKVSTKGIERANAERHKQFDLYATEKDETGKQMVNPEKRQALNRAVHTQETVLKKTLGRDLDPDEIREVTDAMLDYPHGGTKDEIKAWQKGFLDRFNIDGSEDDAPAAVVTAKDADKMGEGKPPPEEKPAPLAKEPTQEEKELETVRFNEADRRRMRELQTTRTASNLSAKERKAVDEEIAALIAKHSKKPASLKTARN